jgi:hypothetical protein
MGDFAYGIVMAPGSNKSDRSLALTASPGNGCRWKSSSQAQKPLRYADNSTMKIRAMITL